MQYHAWAIGSDSPGRSRASSTSDPSVVLTGLCPATSVSSHIFPASPPPIALRHTLPLNSDGKQTEFGATDAFLGQGKGGVVERDFLLDLSATIAGGTSEIQRDIIAGVTLGRRASAKMEDTHVFVASRWAIVCTLCANRNQSEQLRGRRLLLHHRRPQARPRLQYWPSSVGANTQGVRFTPSAAVTGSTSIRPEATIRLRWSGPQGQRRPAG